MIQSGLFNSVNGDRTYNADDLGEFFNGLLTDGLFKGFEDELEVTTPGGVPLVVVRSGKASLLGKYVRTDGLNLTVEAGGASNRYDAVVVGVDLTARTGDIYIKKGEEGLIPVIPSMENTAIKKEICLATILRPAGSTVVTSAQITDKRGDEALCPYVKLTKNLTLDATRSEVIVSKGATQVLIGQAGFDPDSSFLEVYQNGLLRSYLTYTVNGTGSGAYIQLNEALSSDIDSTFVFLVYKTSL